MNFQSKDREALHHELGAEAHRILQYWQTRMVDRKRGGFYGRIDGEDRLHPETNKGIVLNTRILWSFSAAFRHFGDANYRDLATRAFHYLRSNFEDKKYGGVFWMLDKEGTMREPKKQIYAQAFAVYALAEYYRAVKDQTAKDWGIELFGLIEKHSCDKQKGGYLEAFSRDWQLLDDLRLSEKDANEAKTMNTHLHVLEAYTNLYRIWPDDQVRRRLVALLQLFSQTILDAHSGHLQLFFNETWQLRSHKISFGHDIEAAWLLTEAAEVVGDQQLAGRVEQTALLLAGTTLAEGIDGDGGVLNEAGPQGITDTDKDWWPQAEAMVGFFNAYQLSGEQRFLHAALRSWVFIKNHLIDRQNGEWYWAVNREGHPLRREDKAGPWKAPYHNTRACLELRGRLEVEKKEGSPGESSSFS